MTLDLDRMSETAESILTDTATLVRLAKVSNGQGGHTSTWTAVETFDCLLAPVKRQETDMVVADRNMERVNRMLTYPASVELRLADRVSVQGETWSVVRITGPRSNSIIGRAELGRVE